MTRNEFKARAICSFIANGTPIDDAITQAQAAETKISNYYVDFFDPEPKQPEKRKMTPAWLYPRADGGFDLKDYPPSAWANVAFGPDPKMLPRRFRFNQTINKTHL